MARRVQQSLRALETVNLLLFAVWEHGARHVALAPEGEGTEIRYLGCDGTEHFEHLSHSYDDTVKRLRQLRARLGRLHVDIGRQQWTVDAIVPAARRPERIFLHMRVEED